MDQRIAATTVGLLTSFDDLLAILDKLNSRDVSKKTEDCMNYYKRFAKLKMGLKMGLNDELNEYIDKLIRLCLLIPDIIIDSYQKPELVIEFPIVVNEIKDELLMALLEQHERLQWEKCL